MDAQGLELFDAPMDYDVIQEGDYYQDPSIPDSSVTWQYAVVPTNFQFPTGITYQTLSQIHIPSDDYEAIETEAERLASKQDSINCSGGGPQARTIKPYVQDCGPGFHWDFTVNRCVCDCCPDGYHWDVIQGRCVADPPPPPPPPPGPAPDAQIPAGVITVSDVNLGTTPGVRNVRVVAKRWFKIERVYTDNNGNFQCTKHFKNKVKIRVKFTNQYCNIRGIRGLRLWQSLYPVQNTLGVYSGTKNHITYNYLQYANSTKAKGNRYWVAATTNNAIIEHRDYAAQFGFSAAPTGLNVYITSWAMFEGLASTPLFAKRFIQTLPSSFISTQLVYWELSNNIITWYLAFFATVARARLDMAIDYHRADMTRFTSDFIKEDVYHECSHASQYVYSGNSWYGDFVSALLAEIVAHPGNQDPLNPYGSGTTNNSPIIALGESWGYHIGHFVTDQRYGATAICQSEQDGGAVCCNTNFNGRPHIDVLEQFIPTLATDRFRWIPKGLMNDLMDNVGEPGATFVNDQVFGYTIQQIFTALQSDVSTMAQYRARLLAQNPGNPTNVNVNALFASYGY